MVQNGLVILQGVVDTLAEVNHASRVVSAVPGVEAIENNLTISTDGAITDREIELEIEQKLELEPRLEGIQVKIEVNKGEARLIGNVENEVQQQLLQETVSKARGAKK